MDRFVASGPLLEPIVKRSRRLPLLLFVISPAGARWLNTVLVDDQHERRVLGKIRAKGLDQRAFDNQRSLFDAGFNAAETNVAVPRPIGVEPAVGNVVAGQRSMAIHFSPRSITLRRQSLRSASRMRSRSCTNRPFAPAGAHTVVDELKILMERLDLARRAGVDSQRIDRVAAACRALAAGIASTPLSPIHRDFYHDQMLFSPEVDYLLDVDLLSSGDGALDVGNFVAHLIELSLRRPDIAAQLSAVADELPRTLHRHTPVGFATAHRRVHHAVTRPAHTDQHFVRRSRQVHRSDSLGR